MTRPEASSEGSGDSLRLDKWLWQARAFKTRALAQTAIENGRIRVNSQRVTKPGRALRPGDVLTFTLGARTHVWRVRELGTRRGPAPEARGLYEDLSVSRDESGACDDTE